MEQQIQKSKRRDYQLVDPRNIIIRENFNVRNDMGDIELLMNSIIEGGLQIPIKAKKVRGQDDLWEVIDGHRRLMAIQSAIDLGHEIEFIEVIPYQGKEDDEVFSMLITGVGQKPLSEMEQAEGISRLLPYGHKPDQIANRMGKSIPHVYYLIKLNGLPEKYKQLIKEGYISGYAMLEIVENTPEEDWDERVDNAIENAQKSSKNGEVKKATAKDLTERKLKPIEKFRDLIIYLDENMVENDKATIVREVWERINCDENLENIILIIES